MIEGMNPSRCRRFALLQNVQIGSGSHPTSCSMDTGGCDHGSRMARALYQKGIYYSGIKIYNHLPTAIKNLSGDKNKFKLTLKRYLLHNSFYSLEEYFNT